MQSAGYLGGNDHIIQVLLWSQYKLQECGFCLVKDKVWKCHLSYAHCHPRVQMRMLETQPQWRHRGGQKEVALTMASDHQKVACLWRMTQNVRIPFGETRPSLEIIFLRVEQFEIYSVNKGKSSGLTSDSHHVKSIWRTSRELSIPRSNLSNNV